MNVWHSWFAWFPIVVEDDEGDLYLVWWDTVVRRRVYIDGRYRWQYAMHNGSSYCD